MGEKIFGFILVLKKLGAKQKWEGKKLLQEQKFGLKNKFGEQKYLAPKNLVQKQKKIGGNNWDLKIIIILKQFKFEVSIKWTRISKLN